jgi:hypothetical protein
MHGFLWFLQIVLAIAFAAAGLFMLTQPRSQLERAMAWVEEYSTTRIRQIGGLQVLGAIGLILPAWTGILPWLTPLAAAGLLVLMALATEIHYRRRDYQIIPVTAGLGLLVAFVAVFRFGPYSW